MDTPYLDSSMTWKIGAKEHVSQGTTAQDTNNQNATSLTRTTVLSTP